MTPDELRNAIQELLARHPNVSVSLAGHAAHAQRYITTEGKPIGFERDRIKFKNLWVRTADVLLHKLDDIERTDFDPANFSVSKPNHNLFGEPAFKDCNLTRFRVTALSQAERIIWEVAGKVGAP